MSEELVYLASPYSHDLPEVRVKRFHAVCRAAAKLIAEGRIVFSPIAHSFPVAEFGEIEGDWQTWRRQDLAILARCDVLAVLKLTGWTLSVGIHEEIAFAEGRGIRVEWIEAEEE